jgi:hypothetical protein
MVRETGSGDREEALRFFRKRNFHKLDAAIFLSRKIETSGDLLVKRRPPAE